MNDNILFLGAGFSHDANVPLLGGFIERMWEYSMRGKVGDRDLSSGEKGILSEALEIRRELDGYHGRVTFDDRNIEDILSILAFNVLGGGKVEARKLSSFTKAISLTIELACNVKHPGYPENGKNFSAIDEGNEIYRRFWKSLFKFAGQGKTLPTIITLNYDLVLERALFQVLINKYYNCYNNPLPFDEFKIDYKYKHFSPEHYKVLSTHYGHQSPGTILNKLTDQEVDSPCNIEILKLHGSLNFPQDKKQQVDNPPSLTTVMQEPYILPPVSNKRSNGVGDESWRVALNRLREAKNVIFVGYSLPITDMYMQFFLKAALGPNQELNKIFVFDPTLWTGSDAAASMQTRFENCFASQLRPRIKFRPEVPHPGYDDAGTTKHFVQVLEQESDYLIF